MITTFYPPYNFGGDGIFVYRLSRELARRGHLVDVIHCVDSYRLLARREPTDTYAGHPNVTVHGLRSRYGFLSPLATQQTGFPFFKTARIQQVLDKGFDVIHYHNISLVGGPKILEYGQGIKFYTMHEYWLVCPTHVLFKFDRQICRRRNCLLCGLVYRRPPQWWRFCGLLGSMIKHVDAFIAPSRFTRDIHRQLDPHARIEHLPYFVTPPPARTPASQDAASGTPQEPFFLFVGRLEKLKGLQRLIPVFRRYRKAKLAIAGRGGYEPRLRQLAEADDNIRFLGHLSIENLRDVYRQAVAVIVPSLCYDVSPQVVIEAFLQRTPVIVTRLGGMPEMVEESGGGFVYDTDEQLVSAMDELLDRPSYRDQLGQGGLEACQRLWTVEAHMERYFSLIEEIGRTKGSGE
jgi:glycosyltransferase involved in cell wall biosynthesis